MHRETIGGIGNPRERQTAILEMEGGGMMDSHGKRLGIDSSLKQNSHSPYG